jgi:hypothetical protein
MRNHHAYEKKKRRFWDERIAAGRKARELGHQPEFHLDEEFEVAINCPDCNLWGRIVLSPVGSKDPDDIGGRVLTVPCSPLAAHTSESELHWDLSAGSIDLPAMFAGVGYEPRITAKDELIPVGTKARERTKSVWTKRGEG